MRPPPHVPHHSVVRAIGRGSYGEIWLARSLTGAWRAVKIVERARFEDTRSFEREFDGMAKFEPVSREHGGFVDILHVGRSDDDAFFYYVMELADDLVPRPCFEPSIYQPKTLKSELQRVTRLPAEEAIHLGLSLTLALAALHRHGLVHRDIKPANIIFVAGQPKIADIGLVSPLGQASFVGTEGYVPPEGPGTAQADIYSLGKVLYELAMGKDRLDFPEVSTDIDALPDRELLLRLNQVLWRACANDAAHRYATADEMHEDLARVRDGRPLCADTEAKRRWLPVLALLTVGGVAFGWWNGSRTPMGSGSARFESDPPGAQIVLTSVEGRWFKTGDPAKDFAKDLRPGEHEAKALLAGYDPQSFRFTVAPDQELRVPKVVLKRSMGTVRIESDPPGCDFELREGDAFHTGKTPQAISWPTGACEVVFRHRDFEKRMPITVERNEETTAKAEFLTRSVRVTSTPAGASLYRGIEWLGNAPCDVSLLEGEHEITACYPPWPLQTRKIPVGPGESEGIAFAFLAGRVKITTSPQGAKIFMGGKLQGDTATGPFYNENLIPGEVTYTLELEGYKSKEVKATIVADKQTWVPVVFEARPGPRPGEVWDNSLGMRFVPVGERGNLLAGVWPVRVRDFAYYSTETGRPRLPTDFPQDENHPVVRVSWEDANAFCAWLTDHERAAGKLDEGQVYRLPTDAEWSMLAGMPPESGDTPEKRDGAWRDFQWGKAWPPSAPVGNFADAALRQGMARSRPVTIIPNYNDGFPHTSPVGAFPANAAGLFDMSGNVWQWVSDSYNGGMQKKDWGVLRGGSWASGKPEELRLGYRNVVSREERDVILGFRCVLQMAQ